ncbi:MAG: hypothetical protein RLZZ519_926 [Bacteroidota bacterium]|jgi:Spy/CpxP family protein refolding chaperone
MQTATRSRLPWILVTLLVALNITVLALVWLRPPGCNHPMGPRPHGPHPQRGGLAHEIGMSETEALKVEGIQKAHFRKLEDFRDQIIAYRLEAFAKFGMPEADSTAAMAALDKIGQVQIAIEKERYAHFHEVLALCTPEQAKRFQEILPKILSRGPQPENRPAGRPMGPPSGEGPPPN